MAVSALPGGFLPKLAGPCGRALCNCAADICADANLEHCSKNSHTTECSVVLSACSINNAEAPGSAVQLIFSGLLAPQRNIATPEAFDLVREQPFAPAFALSNSFGEIQTPPPRTSRA